MGNMHVHDVFVREHTHARTITSAARRARAPARPTHTDTHTHAQVTEDLKGFPTVFWFAPDKAADPEVCPSGRNTFAHWQIHVHAHTYSAIRQHWRSH